MLMPEGSGSVTTQVDHEDFARAHYDRFEPELLETCENFERYLRCFKETLLGRNKTAAVINLARDNDGETFSVVFRKQEKGVYVLVQQTADQSDGEEKGSRFSLNFQPERSGLPAVEFKDGELVWEGSESYQAKNHVAVLMKSEIESQCDELGFLANVLSDPDLNPDYARHAHAFAEIACGLTDFDEDSDELYEA